MNKLIRGIRDRSAEYWRDTGTVVFALASGIGVLISVGSPGWGLWQTLAATIMIVLASASIWHATIADRRRTPIVRASPRDLLPLNKAWLAEPGQAIVITRDMSWQMDNELRELLADEAARGELTVIAGRMSSTVENLKRNGADVQFYDESRFRPQIRFTVLRWGTSDARILLHRQKNGLVEVFEFERTTFPVFELAEDLLRCLWNDVKCSTTPPVD